jgi:hypothetical protein
MATMSKARVKSVARGKAKKAKRTSKAERAGRASGADGQASPACRTVLRGETEASDPAGRRAGRAGIGGHDVGAG